MLNEQKSEDMHIECTGKMDSVTTTESLPFYFKPTYFLEHYIPVRANESKTISTPYLKTSTPIR